MPTATDNGRVNGGPLYLEAIGSAVSSTVTNMTVTLASTAFQYETMQGIASLSVASIVTPGALLFSDVDALYGVSVGATTYYRKRARDSACVPVTYVYWVTTDPTDPYPGALPCGGPLVDEVIVEVFQQ